MRISLRAVLIGLIALVAIGGLISTGVVSTAPNTSIVQPSKTLGFCSSDGVSLVIDNGTTADPHCAFGFKGTGWELFAATSQKVSGTTEYPVGFVCRINDVPTIEVQPCTATPTSAQGSWAYYFATPETGNQWMFSGAGASMRKPECGSVDGWVFIGPGEKAHEPSIAPITHKCSQ